MPVLSKLSPELDKENDKAQEHSVSSVVREAAMLLMATPLLIDGLMPKKLDRTGSWVRRNLSLKFTVFSFLSARLPYLKYHVFQITG